MSTRARRVPGRAPRRVETLEPVSRVRRGGIRRVRRERCERCERCERFGGAGRRSRVPPLGSAASPRGPSPAPAGSVALSATALETSFARFLELAFAEEDVGPAGRGQVGRRAATATACGHALFADRAHFFASGETGAVACFAFDRVAPLEVVASGCENTKSAAPRRTDPSSDEGVGFGAGEGEGAGAGEAKAPRRRHPEGTLLEGEGSAAARLASRAADALAATEYAVQLAAARWAAANDLERLSPRDDAGSSSATRSDAEGPYSPSPTNKETRRLTDAEALRSPARSNNSSLRRAAVVAGPGRRVVFHRAAQFDALRRVLLGRVESAAFASSLRDARAFRAGSRGGKSNASFAVTADGRFVVKEIRRVELETLVSADFGDAYFERIGGVGGVEVLGLAEAADEKDAEGKTSASEPAAEIAADARALPPPTLLAKIVAAFTVFERLHASEASSDAASSSDGGGDARAAAGVRSEGVEGASLDALPGETRRDVVVIENVFRGRAVESAAFAAFDLKGAPARTAPRQSADEDDRGASDEKAATEGGDAEGPNAKKGVLTEGGVSPTNEKEDEAAAAKAKLPSETGPSETADPSETGPSLFMDEHLQAVSATDPVLVAASHKRLLDASLRADAAFLASKGVMDYSLLAGVDRSGSPGSGGELVVGVIDYLRRYTWDKQLETYVKYAGVLGEGGIGREPTVIGPERYARRFRNAVARYFVAMPEKESDATREDEEGGET